MSSVVVNSVPCEVDLVVKGGDYFAFRVQVDSELCEGAEVNLEDYSYSSGIWVTTRSINSSNPCGGLVKKEKLDEFKIEFLDEDPPVLLLSLDADQTAALSTNCCLYWQIQWFIQPEGARTLAHGNMKVI